MNTELKAKLKEHEEKVKVLDGEEENLYGELKAEFGRELKQWKDENPQYVSAYVRVYNHEFNDGSPTRFSCSITDEWSVEDSDGKEGYIEPPKFIKDYPNNFWEYIFGDEYDSIDLLESNND